MFPDFSNAGVSQWSAGFIDNPHSPFRYDGCFQRIKRDAPRSRGKRTFLERTFMISLDIEARNSEPGALPSRCNAMVSKGVKKRNTHSLRCELMRLLTVSYAYLAVMVNPLLDDSITDLSQVQSNSIE